MSDTKVFLWLTSAIVNNSSDESDSSSWSDMSSVKSESCEDEDEEDRLFFPLMQYLIRLRRKRVDDYLHIVESWSDSEFKNRLRLSRKTAHRLIGKFWILLRVSIYKMYLIKKHVILTLVIVCCR